MHPILARLDLSATLCAAWKIVERTSMLAISDMSEQDAQMVATRARSRGMLAEAVEPPPGVETNWGVVIIDSP